MAAAAAHFGRDLDACLARVGSIVEAARGRGVRLLILPDAALGGYLDDLRAPAASSLPPALGLDAPELRRVAAMARDMVVCLGLTERAGDGGAPFNTAVCLDGDGVLGFHRKVHQPPGEARLYAAGDRFGSFDTPVGRLGLLVDYDKTFPEAARAVALDGAHVIACVNAWPASQTRPADRMSRDRQSRLFDLYDTARAAENQVVLLSSNLTGTTGGLRFLGQAKVVGPAGDVRARTWAKAGLAVAEIDVAGEVARARAVQHHLAERRADAYAAGSRPPTVPRGTGLPGADMTVS